MRRTVDNCKLVKLYGRPAQYAGMCEGFARAEDDDEPPATCQKCKLHYLNAKEPSGTILLCKPCYIEISKHHKVKQSRGYTDKITCGRCNRRRFGTEYVITG